MARDYGRISKNDTPAGSTACGDQVKGVSMMDDGWVKTATLDKMLTRAIKRNGEQLTSVDGLSLILVRHATALGVELPIRCGLGQDEALEKLKRLEYDLSSIWVATMEFVYKVHENRDGTFRVKTRRRSMATRSPAK